MVSVAQAQDAKPSTPAKDEMNQLPPVVTEMLKTQIYIDEGMSNPKGPRLRFVKLDELNTHEMHRFRYRVYADGAPADQPLIFAYWRIGTALKNMAVLSSEAYVNRKGLLLLKKPSPGAEDSETVSDGTELDVALPFAKGEPARFILRSKDNKFLIPGTLVPFPIESTDQGCKLSGLLAEPGGTALVLYAEGFPPNSDVTLEGNSEGEIQTREKHIDKNGHLEIAEFPSVIGKESGTVTETIRTKGCTVSVQIPWGKGSYKPL